MRPTARAEDRRSRLARCNAPAASATHNDNVAAAFQKVPQACSGGLTGGDIVHARPAAQVQARLARTKL